MILKKDNSKYSICLGDGLYCEKFDGYRALCYEMVDGKPVGKFFVMENHLMQQLDESMPH